MSRAFGVAVLVLLTGVSTAFAQPSSAKTNPVEVVITRAAADPATHRVTIDGARFGASPAAVSIGLNALAIVSWSDTQIVATLPDLPPGTYRVVGSSSSFSVGDTTTITVVSAAVTASIAKLVIKPVDASIPGAVPSTG